MTHFLLQLFIFLIAAAISVPLAKKLGLGSVLGYLIAGIVVGPFGLSFISHIEEVMHFTEFGVVMMLFLVGLELKPSLLWKMRIPILGLGGLQVGLTTVVFTAIGLYFVPWQQALAIGMILSLSSTAIVLQTMNEKGQMDTQAGRSVFSVLLFQDLAVIPMLAGLPLLATLAIAEHADGHGELLFDIAVLPGYQQALLSVGAIALVLVVGRFASGPIFRVIARTGVREIFVGTALSLVIGTSLLMMVVGLSPALGAFLAGVVLADSEFRHELESDIEPLKGLLLGIFFISIGATLNFTLIGEKVGLILTITAGLLLVKWAVLYGIGVVFKLTRETRALFAIALAQGGEFAFVLFQFAKTNGVLSGDVIDPVLSAVVISMFLAPVLFIFYDRFLVSETVNSTPVNHDEINERGHRVIIAGFGRIGIDVGRFLLSAGVRPVILDNDMSNVTLLRKLGYEVYFGDASRLDLLESAGAGEADLFIVTVTNENTVSLVEMVKKHYPHLNIIVGAKNRIQAFDLMDLGVESLHRETFGSALEMGQDAMRKLGFDPYEAYRLSRLFKKKDCEMMPALHEMRGEGEAFVSVYQEYHAQLEALMQGNKTSEYGELDKAWATKHPSNE